LVSSLASEAGLSEPGEKLIAFRLRRLLESRLRVEDTFRQSPEIELEHIEAPIFIIGLPRTGTTALSNLIAQDPDIRSLRLWESLEPVPPPDSATERTDPRIAATQAGLEVMDQMYPRMKTLYPQAATGPTECQDLLGMAFRTFHFDGMARVPGYIDWLLGADMRPAYEYHRRVLKLLQWRCPPKRWHLKTPVHTLALDALDSVYPDARFIWTHRDPAEVIGSVCSLITYLRGMVSDRDDRAVIATQQIDLWVEALRRGKAFREMAGEDRFADVHQEDLERDGVGAVRDAYERLGMKLGRGAAEAMRGWLAEHPRGAHGSHSYDLSEFGIDAETVRARFAVHEP
jgi:hypothetical protein